MAGAGWRWRRVLSHRSCGRGVSGLRPADRGNQSEQRKCGPTGRVSRVSNGHRRQDLPDVVLDGDKKLVKRLDENGWNAANVDCYTFFKYAFDGDKLVLWAIEESAKGRAIQSGKVKGAAKPCEISKFTDTTANLARFVAEAGDSLWNTEEPCALERVNVGKKP